MSFGSGVAETLCKLHGRVCPSITMMCSVSSQDTSTTETESLQLSRFTSNW